MNGMLDQIGAQLTNMKEGIYETGMLQETTTITPTKYVELKVIKTAVMCQYMLREATPKTELLSVT